VSTRARPAKRTKRRTELLDELALAGRDVGAYSVMMHTAAAHAVGLNATDHKCLDLLGRHGPMTAGALADLTGLTTGAITGVVDRLEAAGFVERHRDEHDRRRVILAARMDAVVQAYGSIFEPLRAAVDDVADGYTDEQLELIIGYLRRTVDGLRDITTQLRDHSPG
jgi:DNA-binding MarR family transcriptional regulator